MELKNFSVLAKFPILRDQQGARRTNLSENQQSSYDVVDFNGDGRLSGTRGFDSRQEPLLTKNLALTLLETDNACVVDGKDVEFTVPENNWVLGTVSESTISGDELARQLSTKAIKGAIFIEDGNAYFEILGLPGEKAPVELPAVKEWSTGGRGIPAQRERLPHDFETELLSLDRPTHLRGYNLLPDRRVDALELSEIATLRNRN